MPANTPIYNFPYPVGTDFVKDGAAAIEDLALAVEGTIDALPSGGITIIDTKTSAYTLAATDAGKLIAINSTSNLAVTVPVNSSVSIPVGSRIDVVRLNTGDVTLTAAVGVTINSKDSKIKLAARYSAGTLIKTATNTWLLIGDLA
jgi:hypothetical protein